MSINGTSSGAARPAMKVAGLFSGIGGFELGFQRAGHETELLCEIDTYAAAVLSHRFPDRKLISDVSELEALPTNIDVVTAGFPCQNLSMAGDKSGINGTKSSVVDELFRLLEQRRVPWVVIENVYFMLHLAKGAGMTYILNRLEQFGYSWAYRIVDTRAFGLAQRRRRVFIVASQHEDPRHVLLADDCGKVEWPAVDLSKPIGFYWTEGRSGHGLTCDAIPPLKTGSSLSIPSPPAVLWPDGRVVTPSIEVVERLQGFPARWTSKLRHKDHKRFRWKLLGNAVSVPVAEWLGNRLREPGSYAHADDIPLREDAPWPAAAYNIGEGRCKANVSENPLKRHSGRLSAFNAEKWQDLSPRALRGFYMRASDEKTTLRYPPGFLKALKERLDAIS